MNAIAVAAPASKQHRHLAWLDSGSLQQCDYYAGLATVLAAAFGSCTGDAAMLHEAKAFETHVHVLALVAAESSMAVETR